MNTDFKTAYSYFVSTLHWHHHMLTDSLCWTYSMFECLAFCLLTTDKNVVHLQPFPFRRENIWSNLNTFWANDFYFAHLHHQSHRFLITRCLCVTVLHFDRSTHTGYIRMAPVVKSASIYYVRCTRRFSINRFIRMSAFRNQILLSRLEIRTF